MRLRRWHCPVRLDLYRTELLDPSTSRAAWLSDRKRAYVVIGAWVIRLRWGRARGEA